MKSQNRREEDVDDTGDFDDAKINKIPHCVKFICKYELISIRNQEIHLIQQQRIWIRAWKVRTQNVQRLLKKYDKNMKRLIKINFRKFQLIMEKLEIFLIQVIYNTTLKRLLARKIHSLYVIFSQKILLPREWFVHHHYLCLTSFRVLLLEIHWFLQI